jgi:hypothetical protein
MLPRPPTTYAAIRSSFDGDVFHDRPTFSSASSVYFGRSCPSAQNVSSSSSSSSSSQVEIFYTINCRYTMGCFPRRHPTTPRHYCNNTANDDVDDFEPHQWPVLVQRYTNSYFKYASFTIPNGLCVRIDPLMMIDDDESAGAALPHYRISFYGVVYRDAILMRRGKRRRRPWWWVETVRVPRRPGRPYVATTTTTPTPRPNQPPLSWWKSKRPSGRCIYQPIVSPLSALHRLRRLAVRAP